MNPEKLHFSSAFQRLYCDATAYEPFSVFHPISFRRALPFQPQELVLDDADLIDTEEANLAESTEASRRRVVDAYWRCGLLEEQDATNLRGVVDFFDVDFFSLMAMAYANARMFRCALRWCREVVRDLESSKPTVAGDDVYADVGYCLYSLGLFEEAIAWSKSCIGPRPIMDAICKTLIDYEVNPLGGRIHAIERAANRTRFTINAPAVEDVQDRVSRLKRAMKVIVPYQEVYIDWICEPALEALTRTEGYPFAGEIEATGHVRHKLNLIFAICAQADVLMEKGCCHNARRLLDEAVLIEPGAEIIRERLAVLGAGA